MQDIIRDLKRHTSKEMKYLKLKISFIYFFVASLLNAQIYPVTVSTILKPPYPVYLSNYVAGEIDNLTVNITFNDFTEPSWEVYLSLSIESSDISITTKPDFKPAAPVTIYPGQVLSLFGDDLYPYFNYNNLNFSGITAQQMISDGRLPEGHYTFCIKAHDFASGKELSNTSCAVAFITLFEAPMIISPQPDAVIPTNIPLNINFNWEIPGINPITTEYQLGIYELPDNQTDPAAAIESNLAYQIFESEFSTNSWFIYDINSPPLEIGKAYAYRIKSQNIDGKDNIKNNGFSEARKFTFGYPLNGTIELTAPADSFAFDIIGNRIFRWGQPNNLTSNQLLSYNF